MSKFKINMVGGGFQHDICSSAGSEPQLIEWVKGNHPANTSIHIDHGVRDIPVNRLKRNFAWLSESKTINVELYNWCFNNIDYLENSYELLFTHDTELVGLSDKFKLVQCSAKPWVQNYGMKPKSKLVSMVASNKNMNRDHKYRRSLVERFRGQVDLYGRGYNPINTKEEGLDDYYFSITVENGTYPLMYSEKITDCFATGTIPIYYGTPNIGEVFNEDGIIWLTDTFKVSDLTPELYQSKIQAVQENLEIVKNMSVAEDYIYENYIK